MIFSKVVKINIDSLATIAWSELFNSPTNSVCWAAFVSASNYNSFCLLKPTAINL